MLDTFITCLKIIKNYTGLKFLIALTIIVWIYLFKSEKNKTNRILFVYMPAIVMLVVACPLTYFLYGKLHLDQATYYRIIWTVPIGIITVYGLIKIFDRSRLVRIIGVIVSAALIALCGSFIYSSDHLYKATNAYAIPDDVISIIGSIRNADEHERIMVLMPNVLTFYARQYDANICMPYGREMFDINHEYTHPVYELFEVPETIELKELLETTEYFEVEYIVFYAGQKCDITPEEAGLKYIDTVGNYTIYQDPVMEARIAEWEQYFAE